MRSEPRDELPPPGTTGQTFYVYRDKQGQLHMVDRRAAVPAQAQDIKVVSLPGGAGGESEILQMLPAGLRQYGLNHPLLRHALPAAPAAGIAACVVLLALVVRPLRGLILKFGLSLAGMAALGGFYLHSTLSQVAPAGVAATPTGIIDHAKNTTLKAKKAMEAQQQALDAIQE